jgi:hypothetical protein
MSTLKRIVSLCEKVEDDESISDYLTALLSKRRKSQKPRSPIVDECPGSGERLNLSPAEARRGSMPCSHCKRFLKVRVNHGKTANDWPEATMPRHSRIDPKTK